MSVDAVGRISIPQSRIWNNISLAHRMHYAGICAPNVGSSLENVLKCNVYCTSVEKFAAVNVIYARYFPKGPPARIFVCVPAWPG
jgi:enamine deaminase RidA (YjgF/YER057c/UK114 family)